MTTRSTCQPASAGFFGNGHSLVPIRLLLDSTDPLKLARARASLASADRTDLKRCHERIVTSLPFPRVSNFLCHEEWSRRGVPPVFRPQTDKADYPEADFDQFLADAQWLSTIYPGFVTDYQRWRGLFKTATFHKTAEYIFYAGKRPAWRIVAGIGLDQSDQMACQWLRCGAAAKRWNRINSSSDEVRQVLNEAQERRDLRSAIGCDHKATIARRYQIWLCACLNGWRPTPTSRAYETMTGKSMTRQLAAKIMEQLRRDLPKRYLDKTY